MTLWEALGLLGVLALWAALAFGPWWAAVIATRGRIALSTLPLALVAGVGAAALVPAVGGKGDVGFAISLLAAMAGGAVASMAAAVRFHTPSWLNADG